MRCQAVKQKHDYSHALRNAFSRVNVGIFCVLLVYAFLIFLARPHYYGKLSDVFERVTFSPEFNRFPQDLEAFRNVSPQNIKVGDGYIKSIYLGPSEETPNVLFLKPGGSILPSDPYCGCYFVMVMLPQGKLDPLLLIRKDNELLFNQSGSDKRFYIGDNHTPYQFMVSRIDCYELRGTYAFAITGQNLYLLDVFTFRISPIRNWGRDAMYFPLE